MSRENFVNSNITEIIALLDASTSMTSLIPSVIRELNNLVEEQKYLDSTCYISVYTFSSPIHGIDNEMQLTAIREKQSVLDYEPINSREYIPDGMTPLNDALMKVIHDTGVRFNSYTYDKRPGRVIFLTSTDGIENSSKKYPRAGNEAVKQCINHQRDTYDWNFVFTGSDPTTYEQSEELGIDQSVSVQYNASDHGVKSLYEGVGAKITQFRVGMCDSMAFTKEEKKKMEDV